MSTLTAARILSGQRHGSTGEEAQLAWDSFPAVALARVSFSFSAFSTFLYLLLSLSLCPSFLPYLLPFFRRSRFTFVFPFFRSLVFERIYLSPSIPPSAPTLDPLRRMQRASRKCFSLERDPAYITIEPSSSRERSWFEICLLCNRLTPIPRPSVSFCNSFQLLAITQEWITVLSQKRMFRGASRQFSPTLAILDIFECFPTRCWSILWFSTLILDVKLMQIDIKYKNERKRAYARGFNIVDIERIVIVPDLFPSNGSLSLRVNLFKLASIIRIAAFTIVALLTACIIPWYITALCSHRCWIYTRSSEAIKHTSHRIFFLILAPVVFLFLSFSSFVFVFFFSIKCREMSRNVRLEIYTTHAEIFHRLMFESVKAHRRTSVPAWNLSKRRVKRISVFHVSYSSHFPPLFSRYRRGFPPSERSLENAAFEARLFAVVFPKRFGLSFLITKLRSSPIFCQSFFPTSCVSVW